MLSIGCVNLAPEVRRDANFTSHKTGSSWHICFFYLAGFTSSPDMLAPDMMPVTPEKRTPNTVKKLIGTESSNSEQSKANLR